LFSKRGQNEASFVRWFDRVRLGSHPT
jgi:hypothetical protein